MAIKTISVTQLKFASLDSEWREKWLRGENPPANFFSPYAATPVYGAIFHKIAEDYVGWLTSEKDKDVAALLADEKALWHEMYERFAEKRLSGLLESEKIESAYHLGQALKTFCRHVAELRKRTVNFQSWRDIFLTKEFPVKDIQFKIGESSIFVSGQIDAVRTHPEYGIEIVDYKLSHGTNLKHDLLQIAIYSRLLAIIRPGLCFHGVLEYYEPELHEVSVTVAELDAIFQEIVEPVIYELTGKLERN